MESNNKDNTLHSYLPSVLISEIEVDDQLEFEPILETEANDSVSLYIIKIGIRIN